MDAYIQRDLTDMHSASVHQQRLMPVPAAFIAALLWVALPIVGEAAEQGRTLSITRQVTGPTQKAISGIEYKTELQMTATGERLIGTGTVSMRLISGQGPWEYAGSTSVQAEGTLIGDAVRVSITSPKALSLTETRGGTISYPFAEVKEFARFEGRLRDGKYEATETAPTASGVSLLVVTKMDAGAAATGNIVVAAKRDLLVGGAIPGGAGVRRYHYNTLTFTLPDVPALQNAVASGKSIHVAAEVQSSGGRLFKDRAPDRVFSDKEGSREIWWQQGVVPGAEQTFYYAWTAAPPSGAPAKEVVTVKVLSPSNTDLEGTVSFEVGIDLKVVKAGPLAQDGEIEVTERLPLRIAIEDGFRPGEDVAALLVKLGVAPVLKVEHTNYERPKFVGFVVDVFGFDIFNWGEWVMATQMDVHAKDPKKRPSAFYYDDYAWNIGGDGVLGGPETDDYPRLFPRVLGTFDYKLDIAGLTFGATSKPTSTLAGNPMALPDPKSEAKLTVEVTAVPAAEGAFGLLVTCVQAVSSAFGPNLKPAQKLKAAWQILGCLKKAGFATASGAISPEGVQLNATALMAKDMVEKQTRGGTRASDAPLKEVQTLLTEGPGGQVVLLENTGLASLGATSDADGALSDGPASIDLGKLAAKDEAAAREAADSYAPAKRIQRGKLYTAIALAPGETLNLDLTGGGEPGEVIAVTKDRITRHPYPKGSWHSAVQVTPDGTLKSIPGGASSKSAAEQATKSAESAPSVEDLWQKLKEKETKPKRLDGPCAFTDVQGTALITSIEKTERSAHQATVIGGPKYEGLEVRYRFEPQTPIADADAQAFAEATHVFQLANSWYPGPRYVEKYGLAEGRTLPATLRIRTEGSCPPYLVELSGPDQTDYFETVK